MSKNIQTHSKASHKERHKTSKQFLHEGYSSVKILCQKPIGKLFILLTIFLTVFISHFFWGVKSAPDSKWSVHTTMSIIKEGNTNLDEYEKLLEESEYWAIRQYHDHLYSRYPIGTPLIATPFVFVLNKFLGRSLGIDLDYFASREIPTGVETFVASIIIALASVIIYLIGRVTGNSVKYSLWFSFIFAFCTSAWSTGSRALWQHGPSMSLLSCVLYLLLLAKRKPKYTGVFIRLLSLPLAFCYVVRPTNITSIAILTIFIFIQYRKHFLAYCLWSMIVVIPFFVFNYQVYHSLLSSYYIPHEYTSNPLFGDIPWFLEGLAANLVSPARGVLVFSPVLLLTVYGVTLKIKNGQMDKLDYALLLALIAHWLTISSFPRWWAGHCFGPRYFSDVTPFFIYFLLPVFKKITCFQGRKKLGILLVLLCLTLISFFIHYRGATSLGPFVWNFDPVDIDLEPSRRVWDLHDIQFLRPDYVFVPYNNQAP